MPRKLLIRTAEFPYHLRARSNNGDWFALPPHECWSIFDDVLRRVEKKYGFKTKLFLLMGNHFHWLVFTPLANVDEGMRYFMTESSREIARRAGRRNKIYGARYGWSVIMDPDYYAEAFRYICLNPVRAGICVSAWEYSWSTLFKTDLITNSIDIFDHSVPQGKSEIDRWFLEVDQVKIERVRRALRRKVFKFPRDPKPRRNEG
jgi:REP element-mobilizing transposase RayT